MKFTKRERGFSVQKARRALERSVRVEALVFAHWVRRMGGSPGDAAEKLRLKPGTLPNWNRRWRAERLAVKPRGRTCLRSDRKDRQKMIDLFNITGPGVGLPTLIDIFPNASHRELEYMLARYRHLHLHGKKTLIHMLRWTQPGMVWAMDFKKPPTPVDGIYTYIFLVRDLASGNQLLALPVPNREIKHIISALVALFSMYDPPLVLKSDNEFDTWSVKDVSAPGDYSVGEWSALKRLAALLDEHGVFPLLSPPYYPKYNGAIEAGIGSFSTRAHHEAARHGHPEQWNCEDVEVARLQANELARPWGFEQDSPERAWASRQGVSPELRADFAAAVQQKEHELHQEFGQGHLPGKPLGPVDMAAIRRGAISHALVAQGFLLYRRRRITLGVKRSILSNIM